MTAVHDAVPGVSVQGFVPEAPATSLVIGGLAKLSSCDWPGRLVATVFLQGCPWRCTYCQNPELMDPRAAGSMGWEEVMDHLRRRRGLLDGIVLSGGEPTRQLGLGAALDEARELGFATGLHTAGAYPARLARVLPSLDWVGLDLKAPPGRYGAVTGVAGSGSKVLESLALVVASGVDHEVRMTVDPTVHTAADVDRVVDVARAAGAARVVLQEARAEGARPEFAAALGGRALTDVIDSPPRGVTVRRA
jgi:pyruvate formate lyase activating enzyme